MSSETTNGPVLATLEGGLDSKTAYRQPPHNIEAEQALLGAIFVNNDALNKVGDFLYPEHFFEPVHQRIFDATLKLIERGQIANPVTLKHFFDADDALVDVEGPKYLARLAGAAVSIINVENYGRVIFDLAIRRNLIDVGEDMVNDAYDSDIDQPARQQIEEAEQRLFSLAESGEAESGPVEFSVASLQSCCPSRNPLFI